MCWIRLWARSNACKSGLFDWTLVRVMSLVSASKLTYGTGQQVKSQFVFHYLSLSQLIATASNKLTISILQSKKERKQQKKRKV